MKLKGFDLTALLIMLPFLALWFWFGIGSAAHEGLGIRNWVMHLAVPGGILLVSVLVALRWKRLGGALLFLEGIAVMVAYPIIFGARFPLATVALVLLTMGLPPVVSGALFVLSGRTTRA